jgi:hypothetical protein
MRLQAARRTALASTGVLKKVEDGSRAENGSVSDVRRSE